MHTQSPKPVAPVVAEETLRAWISVVRTYNLCDAVLAKRLAGVGLKIAEHEILVNLLHEPGLSQQALARRCFTAKSHMSGLLSSLELRGWITRQPDPTDARAKKLHLSGTGDELARVAFAIQQQVVHAMVSPLNDAEIAVIARTTHLMAIELEKLLG